MTKDQLLELYRLMLDNNAKAYTVDRKQYYEIHLEWEEDVSDWPFGSYSLETEYFQEKTIAFPKMRR